MTRRCFWTCAIVLLALPVAAAQLDTNDLLRCHGIAPNDQKLACYEALAVAAQSGATTVADSAHPSKSSASTDASATTVGPSTPGTAPPTGAASGTAASGAAAVGLPTPAAAPNSLNTEASFGLNRRQVEPQVQGLSSIKSVVSQITEDRRHNITVVLDNGQTWAFIEPEPRLRPGDTITIKHASLGSFLMLTPSRRSYRVERLK